MIFSSYNFKLKGAQHLKDNGNLLALAVDVVKAETYAETMAKVIASEAMTGADIALIPNGEDLQVTINGKSIDPIATADINQDLVTLAIDTVNEEIIICVDATDRIITNEDGDMVVIPAIITNVRELSAV